MAERMSDKLTVAGCRDVTVLTYDYWGVGGVLLLEINHAKFHFSFFSALCTGGVACYVLVYPQKLLGKN